MAQVPVGAVHKQQPVPHPSVSVTPLIRQPRVSLPVQAPLSVVASVLSL